MDVPLIDFGVMWSKGFLVRDIGWKYMVFESGLLGLFLDSRVREVAG